jgi:ABC-2 type transport system permease protein
MIERLRRMLIKEFRQVFRDPRMTTIIFVAPVFQLMIFGYAASLNVRDIPTAIYDLDRTPASRALEDRFAASGYFRVVERVAGETQARDALDRGRARVLIRVNSGFGAAVGAGSPAPVQLILDGTDSITASVVVGYAAAAGGLYELDLRRRDLARPGSTRGQAAPVELATRVWYNENLESRLFFVPGVIGLIVTLITLMLTSMAIVREKEMGTIEQILVSPIRPVEFILGKTLPFLLIGLADVVLVMVVGVFWFGVPVRGNLLFLFLGMLLYVVTSLAVGLLVSTVSRTQQQALMTAFFFFMPAILLSGFVFPIHNMPEVVQWITYLNPLRYLITIVRGVFLKGVGLDVLWPQYAALALLGIVTMFIATKRFHKTLT